MVNYDIANARISGFSTFLGGLALIALLLSVNLITSRVRDTTPTTVAAESSAVLFFLGAMVLFFASTVALISAYTEAERDLASSVRLARSFVGSGVVLLFLGLSSVLLLAFGVTVQASAYALLAIGSAGAFVVARSRLGRSRRSAA